MGRDKKRARLERNNANASVAVDISQVHVEFGAASMDRLYAHRIRAITNTDTRIFLEAMVLPNLIIVLRCAIPIDAIEIKMNEELQCDTVSGKKKKNAYVVLNGAPIMTVTQRDGVQVVMHSPVRGKLLQVNTALLTNPALLLTHSNTLGYVVVIQPNNYILSDSKDKATAEESLSELAEDNDD